MQELILLSNRDGLISTRLLLAWTPYLISFCARNSPLFTPITRQIWPVRGKNTLRSDFVRACVPSISSPDKVGTLGCPSSHSDWVLDEMREWDRGFFSWTYFEDLVENIRTGEVGCFGTYTPTP